MVLELLLWYVCGTKELLFATIHSLFGINKSFEGNRTPFMYCGHEKDVEMSPLTLVIEKGSREKFGIEGQNGYTISLGWVSTTFLSYPPVLSQLHALPSSSSSSSSSSSLISSYADNSGLFEADPAPNGGVERNAGVDIDLFMRLMKPPDPATTPPPTPISSSSSSSSSSSLRVDAPPNIFDPKLGPGVVGWSGLSQEG